MIASRISRVGLVSLLLLSACARGVAPQALDAGAGARLSAAEAAPGSTGEQIYEGRVFALDGREQPLFRYERRVRKAADTLVSSHLTYDPTGSLVVIQEATHTPAYDLVDARLVHGQTGVSGSVKVAGNRVDFELREGGKTSTAQEALRDPVVAGPTMFGYILAHWGELTAAKSLPIRFAVIERLETIGFALDKVESAPGTTTIRMRPSNPLLRLAVDTTYFQFDTGTRKILEYTGRVPPMETVKHRLQTLDARVAYRFVAADFQ